MEVVEPVDHDLEEAVAVVRWRLIALVQGGDRARIERLAFGVAGRAVTGEQAEPVGEVREHRIVREGEDQPVGFPA